MKLLSLNQDHSYGKATVNSRKLGEAKPQGISRAAQTTLVRLMESQIWHPPDSSVHLYEESSEKEQRPLLIFLSGESCSPVLALIPYTSVPPCMPLYASTALLELRGSILSMFVYRFLKRNCLGLPRILPQTQSPLVFAARSYGDLSSWHWNPWLGVLVWGWDSSLPRYLS